jgi:hypothetical protein
MKMDKTITTMETATLTAPSPAVVADPTFSDRCHSATIRTLQRAPSYSQVSTTAPAKSPSSSPGRRNRGMPR